MGAGLGVSVACRGVRGVFGAARIVCLSLIFSVPHVIDFAAVADDAPLSWRDVWKWREVWTGADASKDNWLVYSGITVSPFTHIHEDGLRLRAAGGYGGYRYKGDRSLSPIPEIQSFMARTYFTDALIGYQIHWGTMTAKAFAGVSAIGHDISPEDPENLVIGDEFGAKAVIEVWFDIGPASFASVDLSWSQAHETRAARLRAGHRFWPNISFGLEAALNLDGQADCDLGYKDETECNDQFRGRRDKNELLDFARGGVFGRYEWDGGELSVSAGVSGGAFRGSRDSDLDPYMTINWLKQF